MSIEYPSRRQARRVWQAISWAALLALFGYMAWNTSFYESKRERNLRRLHATNLAVAMVLSPIRHSLSEPAAGVLAACTVRADSPMSAVEAAFGPDLAARLRSARSLADGSSSIVIFYEKETVVLRATDMDHRLVFKAVRTMCAREPALLVKGLTIDFES